MVSTSNHARRYDMPSDFAAAVIDPVLAMASRRSIFPGPTAMFGAAADAQTKLDPGLIRNSPTRRHAAGD